MSSYHTYGNGLKHPPKWANKGMQATASCIKGQSFIGILLVMYKISCTTAETCLEMVQYEYENVLLLHLVLLEPTTGTALQCN